jgi:uncharacterized protein
LAPIDPPHLAAACIAAFLAGSINSVAGGGTLITFPTLIWLGLPSIEANATNTVAIWPGSLGSIWGFRREFREIHSRMRWLAVPSILGGAVGAILLRMTPTATFDRLVPFLILFATLLFLVQGPIQSWLRKRSTTEPAHNVWLPGALLIQFFIAIYGGYFGAGAGIVMLSALSLQGMSDILQMSALTSFYALCMNGIASILFIAAGMIYWPYVLPMAIAAIIGGYGAAGLARKIGKVIVRRFVVAVGLVISVVMFVRAF